MNFFIGELRRHFPINFGLELLEGSLDATRYLKITQPLTSRSRTDLRLCGPGIDFRMLKYEKGPANFGAKNSYTLNI
jgi:hypothetical protein